MPSSNKNRSRDIEKLFNSDQIGLLNENVVLVGGTAIAIMLGAEKIFNKSYPRSPDVDVIMGNLEVESLKKKFGDKLVEENMTDRNAVRLGSGMAMDEKHIELKSPFTVMRIEDSEIDIFTKNTGLGAISVDKNVFDSAVTYKMWNKNIKIAHPSYLIATTLNPLVATDERIKRSFLIIYEYVKENGSKAFFDDVLKPALEYIDEGSQNLEKRLNLIRSGKHKGEFDHILKHRSKVYAEYATYMSHIMPNRLDTEKRKIGSFMAGIGVCSKEDGIKIVNDVASFLRRQ